MSTLSGYAGSEKTLSGIISGNFDSASASSLSVSDLTVDTLSSTSVTSSDATVTGNLNVGNDVTVSDAITCASLSASGAISGSSATISGTTTTGGITCSGTANLVTVNITGTTTVYRPLSSVSTVTITGATSLATTTASALTVSGATSLATTTATSLTCSGTSSLKTTTVTLSGASDVFTIQNTTAHPTISLSGTATSHGYIGFYDNLGATKGSVYASSSKNAVVIDVGSLSSGFLVQKSGTTKMTLTPDGNLLTSGTIACDGGFISYGADSFFFNATLDGLLSVTPTTPNTTAIQVNTGNVNLTTGNSYRINDVPILTSTELGSTVTSSSLTSIGTQAGGVNIATGQTYKVNGTNVLSATTLGSGVTSSSLTSVGTLSSLTVTGNLTVDTNTLFVNASNNRVGISNSNPQFTLDISGGVNVQSGSVYRINGTPVIQLEDSTSVRIPLNLYISGVVYANRPSFKCFRTGSWSVSANSEILTNGTINFTRNPASSSNGYNGSTGRFVATLSGVWHFSVYLRHADTNSTTLGCKPNQNGSFAIANSDNTYWFPNDGANRRCLTWTETCYMNAGDYYTVLANQSSTYTDFVFSGECIGS